MNINAGIQRAIEIGKRNQEIETLMTNYCHHAKVEPWVGGGRGMVEEMTGLPIGMRIVRCVHATQPSMAGMNLEAIALGFYERSCLSCSFRKPGRLPNISALHGRIEEEKREKERRDSEWRVAVDAGIKRRKEARAFLRMPQDAMREELIDLLDKIDAEGSSEALDKLALMAQQVPARFDEKIVGAIRELGAVGGYTRAQTSLRVLHTLRPTDPEIVRDALRSLARCEAVHEAGQIVEARISKADESLVSAAVPELCRLAAPPHPPFGGRTVLRPGPLIAAYKACPDAIIAGIEKLLDRPEKEARISAAQAVERLISEDHTLGPKLAKCMLDSLSLPDDGYDDGFSSRYVANALAMAMLHRPAEIDVILQNALSSASHELSETIFEAYEAVPRVAERKELKNTAALKLTLKRSLEILLSPSSKLLNEAVQVVDYITRYFPEALDGNEDLLFGAAALVETEKSKPAGSKIIDPGWNPLKGMEEFSRDLSLGRAIECAGDAIESLAARNPAGMLPTLGKTFEGVRDREDAQRLRAVTVRGFAGIAMSPEHLGKALHHIYTAMADPAPIVRAEAAKAYGKIANAHGAALPILLHQTILLLLADPFVIVHKAALDALSRESLPAELRLQLFNTLFVLCEAYSQDSKQGDFLRDGIFEFLAVAEQLGVRDKMLEHVMRWVDRMDTRTAAKSLPWLRLAGAASHPTFAAVAIRLVKDTDLYEHETEDILRVLKAIPASAAKALVPEIVSAAVEAFKMHLGRVSLELAEFLVELGEVEAVENIWKEIGAWLPNTTEKTASKRDIRLKELAARIELVCVSGDASKQIEEWKDEAAKAKKDDELEYPPFP